MECEKPAGTRSSSAADESARALESGLAGEPRTFEDLVATHERRVYNLACRMLGDAEEARDATQEIFLRVHQNLGTFRGEARFGTWLYRVAMNYLFEHRRRWLRMPWLRLNEAFRGGREAPESTELKPDELLVRRERVRAIRRAIGRLSPKLRATLVLRDLEGLSYGEISDVLGVTEGTVASRLNEARKQLARRLRHLATEAF